MFRLFHVLFLMLTFANFCLTQISPGDLSEPHKNLEGMGNCTQCHTMGKAISNDNCLHCHTEINTRIGNKKGYHASLRSKECIECHKEHHGRNFTLIRFEKTSFDHTLTGYTLEGKHTSVQCEKCHTKAKISAADIRVFSDARKATTFLGLGTACVSCHKDEHRGQFKQECLQCHTMNGWKPASKFSHDNAQFKLVGAHATVQCAKCHKKTLANKTVTQFIHLEFESCRSCHTDPHKGKFKQECSQCHTVESWHQLKSASFDHNTTQFPLLGKHTVMKCEQCHPKDSKMKNPSGDLGFHIVRFKNCKNCHSDAHARQFDSRKDRGECTACHTEQGFGISKYTIVDHNNSRFSLQGSHRAVPCVKCHLDGKVTAKSTRQFHWNENIVCTTCHIDIHKGQFTERMTNGCETCHSTNAWDEVMFLHEKTNFPLRGKHADIKCIRCHPSVDGVQKFKGVPLKCNQCHEDQHAGQFDAGKGTHCEQCHIEKNWKAVLFDHDSQSRFSLTGKHQSVKCEKCHKETVLNNKKTIKYKPLEAACVDCHPAQ